MQTVTFLTSVLLLLIKLHSTTAIDLRNAKESSCFPIKETVPVDENFLAAHKTWYYPIMNRFDLYFTGIMISGKEANKLQEDELYYDGCFNVRFDEQGNFDISGFNGRRKVMQVTPVEGTEAQVVNAFFDGKMIGTMYNVLTDNTTFVLIAACTVDDEMTWGVVSPIKRLPVNTVNLIHEHVQSLGFNRDFFTGIRYDQCEKDVEKLEVTADVPNIITLNF